MQHKEITGFPHLRIAFPFLVALIIIIAILISTKTYAQSPARKAWQTYEVNNPSFVKYDTVVNTHTHTFYVIKQQQFRPDKKQVFYSAYRLDNMGPVENWLPENSIRKVKLIWVDRVGPVVK